MGRRPAAQVAMAFAVAVAVATLLARTRRWPQCQSAIGGAGAELGEAAGGGSELFRRRRRRN
jgi:hypothetical protein